MKTNTKWLIILSGLAALCLPGVSAYAAAPAGPNYCFPVYNGDYCWSSMRILDNYLKLALPNAVVGVSRSFAVLFWIIDRAAAFIFSKTVLENAWLMSIRTQMLGLFQGLMPGMLRDVAFGSSGLMYVALSLAGLLLMLPLWGGGARFVRAERVMLWGILLSMLFVASSFGYDFVGAFETFRQNLVSNIVQGGASLPLDKLLLQPFRAGDGDLGLSGNLWKLPPVYESSFFPEPELIEVTIAEGGLLGIGNAEVEREEKGYERAGKALTGLVYATVSLAGAYLMLVIGFAYALMSFTAMTLMLFLFAALPLGFFEIGGQILYGIVQQYFRVFVQSLTLAIFLRWLSGGMAFVTGDVNTLENAMMWLVIIVLMSIIAQIFFNGSWRILLDSGSIFSAVNSSFGFGGPTILQTAQAAVGRRVEDAAGSVATLAAMVGRPDVALAAGAVAGVARHHRHHRTALENYGRDDRDDAPTSLGNVFVSRRDAATRTAVGATTAQTAQPEAAPAPGTGGATTGTFASPSSIWQGATPAPLPSGSGTDGSPPQEQQIWVDMPNLSVTEANVVFKTIVSQNAWDEEQQKQVNTAIQAASTPQEAVNRLALSPGFERTSTEDLRKAVNAARILYDNQRRI